MYIISSHIYRDSNKSAKERTIFFQTKHCQVNHWLSSKGLFTSNKIYNEYFVKNNAKTWEDVKYKNLSNVPRNPCNRYTNSIADKNDLFKDKQ